MTKGGVMDVTVDKTHTLRAQDHGHPPVILEPRSPDGVPRVYTDGVIPTLNTCGGQRLPCVFIGADNHSNDQYE